MTAPPFVSVLHKNITDFRNIQQMITSSGSVRMIISAVPLLCKFLIPEEILFLQRCDAKLLHRIAIRHSSK